MGRSDTRTDSSTPIEPNQIISWRSDNWQQPVRPHWPLTRPTDKGRAGAVDFQSIRHTRLEHKTKIEIIQCNEHNRVKKFTKVEKIENNLLHLTFSFVQFGYYLISSQLLAITARKEQKRASQPRCHQPSGQRQSNKEQWAKTAVSSCPTESFSCGTRRVSIAILHFESFCLPPSVSFDAAVVLIVVYPTNGDQTKAIIHLLVRKMANNGSSGILNFCIFSRFYCYYNGTTLTTGDALTPLQCWALSTSALFKLPCKSR